MLDQVNGASPRHQVSLRSLGVFWDAQDVVLEDVERIEVIRGPGATHQVRSGFRIDAEPSARELLTLSGDVYEQDYGSTAVPARC